MPSLARRRPRLDQLLDRDAGRRIVLVRGPAGAGKTTLVAQWVATRPDHCAWLSVEVAHNDPTLLLTHLIETVRQRWSDARGILLGTSTIVAGGGDAVLRDIVGSVTNRVGTTIHLVLDGVDRITDPGAGDILRRLVERPPEALRLVLISRSKPRLGLERARLRGDLVDIGPTVLRFTRAEIEELGPTWTGRRFDAGDLEQDTLGWAAGLRLAELAAASMDAPSWALREPDGFAREYVREELLEGVSDRLRSFLEVTCWLPVVTGAMCAALAGQDSDHPPLSMPEMEALPLLPVSSRPGTFRYPPVLTRVLQDEGRRRGPVAVRQAIGRAAAVAQRAGELLTAFELFLQADDLDRAADVCRALATVGESSLRAVDALLRRRPELVSANRRLLPWRVRASVAAGHVDEACALLSSPGGVDLVGDASDQEDEPEPECWVRARGAIAEHRGDGSALLTNAERLLDFAARGEVGPLDAVQALGWRLRALVWSGEIDRARAALAALDDRYDGATVEVALARAWAAWSDGDVATTATCAAAARQGEDSARLAEAVLLEGSALREHNQVAKALPLLREAHALATTYAHDVVAALAASELARCQRTAGTSMDALEGIVSARVACPRLPTSVDLHLRAIETRIRLDQGDLAGAQTVVRAAPSGPDAQLLLARVTARQASTRAAELLATVTIQTPRQAVEKLLLLAQLPDVIASDRSAALLEAVAIAEPLGIVRTFLDEGAGLSRQLSELACDHRDRGLGRLGALARQELAQAPAPETTPLFEDLTARELAVLRMLPLRMSNSEMAAEMYISVNTLKTHVRAIYRKLDVPHRSAAVRRAKALQLV